MEEKKLNYGLIIFIVVLVILFIPIISDYIKKQNIEILSSSEISEKIDADKSFVLYVGDLDKTVKKELKRFRDATKTDYSYEYDVYNTKSNEDIKKLLGDKVEVAMVIEGDIQKTYAKYDEETISKDVDKYLLAKITEENASYKVAKDFKSYKKIVKSDEVTMSVFGRESCSYCNLFMPVYNAVAEKYEVDIYYFDSDNYDTAEYKKIVNLNLTVPSKCSSSGAEFKLSDGFGTPLTIFTKSGKVVDCISGYVNRSALVEKLKSVEMISE